MFSNIDAFGRQLFLSLFLIVCCIVAAHLCFGYDTRRAKEAFVVMILLLMIGVQYYFLVDTVSYVPATRFFVYNTGLSRFDCLASDKGGKRPRKSREHFDINPCFCQLGTCYSKTAKHKINGTCPTDGSASCLSATQDKISLYLSPYRNCKGGQGPRCTKDQPCYPCQLSKVIEFNTNRCRTCSTDYDGDCHFIPEIGPYCFDRVGSKRVVPCTKCCTEYAPPKIVNNTCY